MTKGENAYRVWRKHCAEGVRRLHWHELSPLTRETWDRAVVEVEVDLVEGPNRSASTVPLHGGPVPPAGEEAATDGNGAG